MLGRPDDPRWNDKNWISVLNLSVNPPVCYYYWNGIGEVPAQYREKADKSVQTIFPFQGAKSSNPKLLAERRRRLEEERRELAMEDETQKDKTHKDKKIELFLDCRKTFESQ